MIDFIVVLKIKKVYRLTLNNIFIYFGNMLCFTGGPPYGGIMYKLEIPNYDSIVTSYTASPVFEVTPRCAWGTGPCVVRFSAIFGTESDVSREIPVVNATGEISYFSHATFGVEGEEMEINFNCDSEDQCTGLNKI